MKVSLTLVGFCCSASQSLSPTSSDLEAENTTITDFCAPERSDSIDSLSRRNKSSGATSKAKQEVWTSVSWTALLTVSFMKALFIVAGFAAFAHNIQPWAWDYLNEHRDLLGQ